MTDEPIFADVLRSYMQRMPYNCTPGLLGKLAEVPKGTIVNWLNGVVARPRHWQDVLRVAHVLRLTIQEVNHLLQAANHQDLETLRAEHAQPADQGILAAWATEQGHSRVPRLARLPAAPTPLIGREPQRALLRGWLERPAARLITLTGPGGIGKSRLALAVADEVRGHYRDGVCFVALASLTDALLVAPTIAQELGLTERVGDAQHALIAYLRDRNLLLLLDNFEHVSAAAPLVAEIVQAAPLVTVLVTSRRVLQLYGEQEYMVPPLTLPDLSNLPPVDQLLQYEAVALFVRRTEALDPSFTLTTANAPIVAAICVRLEGLPLSIELAAARGKLLDPPRLLARLADLLGLLTWGPRHIPTRQQTLRNTLDWSYHLLDLPTQQLFAQLAVFMGGCTLEAAQAVCRFAAARPPDGADAIADGLMQLMNHSLLTHTAPGSGAHRLMMLETIRQYAEERLKELPLADATLRQHTQYYLALAEQAAQELTGANQIVWLDQLETEHDNMRVALKRSLAWDEIALAGQLCRALWRFWMLRGHLQEGRMWIANVLVHEAALAPALHASVLLGGGRLARQQGDLASATRQLEASLAIWRSLEDHGNMAMVLGYLGVVAYDQQQFAQAAHLHQESLALRQAIGDLWGIAATLTNLGEVARQQGDPAQAFALQQQSLATFRRIGDQVGMATALTNMGMLLTQQGEYAQARAVLAESLVLWDGLGEQVYLAENLEGVAGVLVAQGQAERAVRLAGAAATIRTTIGAPLPMADRARYEVVLDSARRQLDPARFAKAWQAGAALSVAEAVAEAQ
jgi:predicted ATPase